MIKVSEIVEKTIQNDPIAKEALVRGLLNMSAYAKDIKPLIEDECMKPVQTGTIVVALSRIQIDLLSKHPFLPEILVENLGVKSDLCEITYEKTEGVLKKLATLDTSWVSKRQFFTVTEGISEVTIICSQKVKKEITNHFGYKPKKIFESLVAVTCKFSEDYLSVPNAIFSITASIAIKNINIIEIVSTYTELSYIVDKKDLEKTVQALQAHL